MTTHFITNQDKFLSDVIKNVLPSSKNLYFLVGYFYFSGFQEIYQQVAEKNLKILVGLEIEHDLTNKIKEFEILQETNLSRGQVRHNYYNSLVQLFNETDFFDSEGKKEAFKLFLAKIENGTLELRKTIHSNHAKLYIFENKEEFNQGGEYPGTVITGSSNLTRSGLKSGFEINVISRDSANYNEAYKIFQELWKDSITIVDRNNIDDFFYNVIEKVWVDKLPKPYLLFVRVLDEYFRQYNVDTLRLPGGIPNVLLVLDANDNNSIVKTYIHAQGQVICQHDGNYDDDRYFYLHDRRNSVRELVDTSGNVVNCYYYTPWGGITSQESDETVDDWYLFANYWGDPEIESYYCDARWYYSGRFMSRDPVKGTFKDPTSLHPYMYCLNDPVNRTDPSGRLWGALARARRVVNAANVRNVYMALILNSGRELLDVIPSLVVLQAQVASYLDPSKVSDLDPAKTHLYFAQWRVTRSQCATSREGAELALVRKK